MQSVIAQIYDFALEDKAQGERKPQRPTTPADVDFAVARYREAVRRLRGIAPPRVA